MATKQNILNTNMLEFNRDVDAWLAWMLTTMISIMISIMIMITAPGQESFMVTRQTIFSSSVLNSGSVIKTALN